MSHFFGILMMFLAACSYGASAVVIKLAYRAGLQPGTLLTWQNLVAVACLWPFLLLASGFPRVDSQKIRRLVWQGLGGNFALSVCYFWAAQRIDVSLLSLILFTYPCLVLLYQIVIDKHKTRFWELLALAMACGGVALAVGLFRGAAIPMDRLGLVLSAGAAVSYAFMNIHGQKLTRDLPPLIITTMTSTVSTLAMVAVLPARDWLTVNFSSQQWLFIATLALLSTVLPMNLMYLAIRRIGAFHASVVSIAELPCILVLACFILRERLNPAQWVGGVMILLSLILIRPAEVAGRPATGSEQQTG